MKCFNIDVGIYNTCASSSSFVFVCLILALCHVDIVVGGRVGGWGVGHVNF